MTGIDASFKASTKWKDDTSKFENGQRGTAYAEAQCSIWTVS